MSDEPTAANPRTITLCWTPEQNFGQVSVFPSRAPIHAVLGLLRAGETPETVAYEHDLSVDEVRLLGRLVDGLIEIVHRDEDTEVPDEH